MPPRGVIRTIGRGAGLRAYAVREDGRRMEVEHAAVKPDGKENICHQGQVQAQTQAQTQAQAQAQGGRAVSEQTKQADKAHAAPPTEAQPTTAQCALAPGDGHTSSGARRDCVAAVRTLRGGNRRKRPRFTPVLPVIYEDAILV